MSVMLFLSEAAVPLVITAIVAHGFLSGTDMYQAFIEGAADGIRTVAKILPTLIGLMAAVGVLSGSGALGALTALISPVTDIFGFPQDAVPLAFMRLVSSSASVGLILDIFKTHGPDSFEGRYVSVLMSCTETVFYTMSVYFISVNVTKTRHTLFCALVSCFTGVALSLLVTLRAF